MKGEGFKENLRGRCSKIARYGDTKRERTRTKEKEREGKIMRSENQERDAEDRESKAITRERTI